MGSVATPSGLRKGRKKAVEELARDLDPAKRSELADFMASSKGEESEKDLRGPTVQRPSKRDTKRRKP